MDAHPLLLLPALNPLYSHAAGEVERQCPPTSGAETTPCVTAGVVEAREEERAPSTVWLAKGKGTIPERYA